MSTITGQSITRADVEAVAASEGKPVLEVLSLLQTGAAHLNDGEQTLDALCAIKAEILGLPEDLS